jgi:uncharacterized protein YdhG (YjbR/CyaY superfamily)
MRKMNEATTIDGYIADSPKDTQKHLKQIRQVVRKLVPDAKEDIKYGMPTYVLNGNLLHFAGFEHHIGFYPTPTGIASFKKDLAPYKQGKGSVQFPLDKPMPLALITRIIKYRLKQNLEKGKKKK